MHEDFMTWITGSVYDRIIYPIYKRLVAITEVLGDEVSEAAREEEWEDYKQRWDPRCWDYYLRSVEPPQAVLDKLITGRNPDPEDWLVVDKDDPSDHEDRPSTTKDGLSGDVDGLSEGDVPF